MSFKHVLSAKLALTFLVFGTISCSQDKAPPLSEFKIAPPQFEFSQGKVQDWAALTLESNTLLSPSDQILFGPDVFEQNVSVVTIARCLWAKINDTQRSVFQSPRALSFIEILPRALSLASPGELAHCQIQFEARNAQGARHVFFLPQTKFKTSSKGKGLQLKAGGQFIETLADQPLAIAIEKAHEIYVVNPEAKQSQVELLCERHRLQSSRAAEPIISLGEFNPRTAEPLDGAPRLDLTPLQNCRFVAVQNKQVRLFSDLLQIRFQHRPLEITWMPSKNILSQNNLLHLGMARIRNNTEATLRLRRPDPHSQPLHIRAIQNASFGELGISLDFSTEARPDTNGDFVLAPGESLTLLIRTPKRVFCKSQKPQSGPIQFAAQTVHPVGFEWIQPGKTGQANANKSSGVIAIIPAKAEFSWNLGEGAKTLSWTELASAGRIDKLQCQTLN